MITLTHIPTAAEIANDRSTVVGSFEYPEKGGDEGDYADACAEVEQQAREEAAQMLNDHGIDTASAEIRISEIVPGEIRVVW